jgi:hypothetical protein
MNEEPVTIRVQCSKYSLSLRWDVFVNVVPDVNKQCAGKVKPRFGRSAKLRDFHMTATLHLFLSFTQPFHTAVRVNSTWWLAASTIPASSWAQRKQDLLDV